MSNIHTRGQFIDFCKLVFKDYQLTNSGINIQVVCPICKLHKGYGYNKKKFAIETQTHINHCWSCGYKSRSLRHILKKYNPNFLSIYKEQFCNSTILEDELSRKAVGLPERKIVTLPEDFMLLAVQPKDSTEPCVELSRRYLEARGIKDESMYWYWKFGVSKSHPDLFKILGSHLFIYGPCRIVIHITSIIEGRYHNSFKQIRMALGDTKLPIPIH